MEELIYQNESLHIKVSELEEELRICGGYDIQALREERDVLKQDMDLLKVQLKEKTEQLESLSAFNSSVQTLMETLKEEKGSTIEDKNLQIERLQHQVAEYEALLQAQRVKETSAEEDRKAREKALQDLRSEYDMLQEDHQQLKCQYEHNRGAVEALQSHLDRLQMDHDALLEEKVSLNHTMKAMPTESLLAKRVQQKGEGEVTQRVAEEVAKLREKSARDRQAWQDEKAELVERIRVLEQQQQKQQESLRRVAPASHTGIYTNRASRALQSSSAQIISQHRRSLDSFHNRMNHLLELQWDIPEEIQDLIQNLLDSHENAIEDFQNQIMIKEIQLEDIVNDFHIKIKRMEERIANEERSAAAVAAAAAAERRFSGHVNAHADPSPQPTEEADPSPAADRLISCSRCTFEQPLQTGICSMCGAELVR